LLPREQTGVALAQFEIAILARFYATPTVPQFGPSPNAPLRQSCWLPLLFLLPPRRVRLPAKSLVRPHVTLWCKPVSFPVYLLLDIVEHPVIPPTSDAEDGRTSDTNSYDHTEYQEPNFHT
jgi:hypothetical protein